ncbi:hypothetical protein DFH07DRAFT_950379 [Mycena maculata]|uniref:Uncharacterized protein n=1 Tax=Mycena maculata TaxID=230809 RepID=A0AAD7K6F4_9AGAR|nr:hypothetical protein DFH07DRAFT_950379 [Mycena maculata]
MVAGAAEKIHGQVAKEDHRIGGVCCELRNVMISTPALWCDIRLVGTEETKHPLLNEQIKRTRNHPIRLLIHRRKVETSGDSKGGAATGEVLACLIASAPRWTEATIMVDVAYIPMFAGIRGHLAQLQYLDLRVLGPLNGSSPSPMSGHPFELAPALRELGIHTANQVKVPMDQITLLFGTHSTPLHRVLVCGARNLVDLRFSPGSHSYLEEFTTSPMTLPKVRRLYCPALAFLRMVILPALEELALATTHHVRHFEHFLIQSPETCITKLTITHASWDCIASMEKLLWASKGTTSLVICLRPEDNDILRALTMRASGGTVGLRIESITVVLDGCLDVGGFDGTEELEKMITSRMCIGEEACAQLRSIQISSAALPTTFCARLVALRGKGLEVTFLDFVHDAAEHTWGEVWESPLHETRIMATRV